MKKIVAHCFVLLCLVSFIHSKEKVEDAYCNLAEALREDKKPQEALQYYQKALSIDPTHMPAILGLGKFYLYDTNDTDKAIEYFEKRLCIKSDCHQTELLLAKAWEKKKEIDKAIDHYKKALTLNPKSIQTYKALAENLKKKNLTEDALQIYKKALQQNPKDTGIYIEIIELLMSKKRLKEALNYCNKLIAIEPHNDNHKIKKGHILSLLAMIDKAIDLFESLSKKHKNNPKMIYNLAYLYKKKSEYEKSVTLYKKVLELKPNNRKAVLGLSQSYLALGHFTLGWKFLNQYNTRKKIASRLTKVGDIAGKKILVQGEWNSEDMLQFVRYVTILKKYGANEIMLQAPGAIHALLKNCPYADKILNINQNQHFDRHIPITSLPNLFEAELKTIPCEIPYIYPSKDLCETWKNQLQYDKKFRVGIYMTKKSEIPLSTITQVATVKNISTYILSPVIENNCLQHVPQDVIVHVTGKGFSENDFDNLAAIVKNMDLIVTCDSTVAHIAGALGVPVWVILPKIADWRWMKEGEENPWYPTMKLFRLQNNVNLQNIIDQMIKILSKATS